MLDVGKSEHNNNINQYTNSWSNSNSIRGIAKLNINSWENSNSLENSNRLGRSNSWAPSSNSLRENTKANSWDQSKSNGENVQVNSNIYTSSWNSKNSELYNSQSNGLVNHKHVCIMLD